MMGRRIKKGASKEVWNSYVYDVYEKRQGEIQSSQIRIAGNINNDKPSF